jgi:protein-S-isoprenylcysteine O-methyltransferase Ste14
MDTIAAQRTPPRPPLMVGVTTGLLLLTSLVLVAAALVRWRTLGWPPLVWLAGYGAMSAIRLPHHRRNRRNAIVTRRLGAAERLVLAAMFATMMLLPLLHLATGLFAFADYPLPAAASGLGAALVPPLLWLFYRSHADLGRNWSPGLELRRDHQLVTRGVYARWRHPMYVAIGLSVVAQPLLIHNAIAGALALPAFAALCLLRVPQEEAMMRERFGADYDAYRARVGWLWPRR